MKISVILPIYNVANYLGEALDSIINQTIGIENLEVIMVDDGSTDESMSIMKKYASEYKNFKIFHFDEKSGAAGKPRNEGLKHATAPYIMFLDPDDAYDKDACKKMYDLITANDVDIVSANYEYMEEDGTIWGKPVFDVNRFKTFMFGTRSFSKSVFIWNSGVCNKIFRRKIINDNSLYFLEGVPAEDAFFSYSALLKSKKIYYLSEVVYYYRRRNNDSNLSISWDRSINYFNNINYAYKKIYELFEGCNKLELYRYFYSKTLTSVFYKIVDTNIMTKDEKMSVLETMQWFFKQRKKMRVEPCQRSLNIVFEKIDQGKFDDAVNMCTIIAEIRNYVPKDIRESMSKPENISYLEVSK